MRRGRTFRKRRQNQRQTLAASVRGKASQDNEWTALRKWCAAQGMPKNKLTVAYFPDTFRGMMATKDIDAGEELVQVPERLLITASKVKQAVLAGNALDSWRLSEHQTLAYWIYAESNKSTLSMWAEYIETLPRDFPSVPLYVLSGSEPAGTLSVRTDRERWVAGRLPHSVLQRTREQHERLFSDWVRTREGLTGLVGVEAPSDWRAYVWAWLVVNTRCIHLGRPAAASRAQPAYSSRTALPPPPLFQPISDCDSITLAPVLDLLNHSAEASVAAYFDRGRRLFAIKTLRGYRRGEEAFISYGVHDNGFMLAEYGFVLADNPHCSLELDHEVGVWISAVKAGLLLRRRSKREPLKDGDVDMLVGVLKRHGLWGDYTLGADRIGDRPYRLHAALYLVLAALQPGAGLKGVVSRWERWQRGEIPDVDAGVEAAAREWIERTCGEVAEYSTRMVGSIQAEQNECVDPFLVRCIGTLWATINRIASGQQA